NTLIIDPQLNWGTFFGGTGFDGPTSIETDNLGNIYIAVYINSTITGFPLQNLVGAYNDATYNGGTYDVIISKFSNNGNHLWSTLYGGSGIDWANSIACDNTGNIFLTGYTLSTNFPTLNPAGGAYFQGTLSGAGSADAFILKFSNLDVRLWATYYGGSGNDYGNSLTCDNAANMFVTGSTSSPNNFPTWNPLGGAYFQGTNGGGDDSFILKFSNTGVRLWATYYGGSSVDCGYAIDCDNTGNVFVTWQAQSTNFPTWNPLGGAYFQGTNGGGGNNDAFILKFSNTGVRLWAKYYGGSSSDEGYSIICDNTGNVFISGQTVSTNFPTFNPAGGAYFQGALGGVYDAFILKFSNTGIQLWATYYGGSANERAFWSYDNLAVDACGNVYLTFSTLSTNIPTLSSQSSCGGFNDNSFFLVSGFIQDLFLIKFTNSGQSLWATYIGGNGDDFRSPIATDNNGNLFVSGEWINATNNATYPLVNPGGGAYYDPTFNGNDDGFLMKFTPIPPTYAQSQTNPSGCSACNGVATISVTCGEAPYTYQWSNAVTVSNTTLTSHSITGLCPGVYQVTVTSNCNYSYTTNFDISCPLPIELLEFTAKQQSNIVECIWRTATEINNDYFTVEKSTDAINFEIVGKIKVAGNSNTIKNYNMSDEKPYNGVSYYRLKQTDFDGTFKYSKLVSVNFQLSSSTVSVFPNPSSGNYTILNTEYTDVYILDELGRIIKSISIEPYKSITISLNTFNNGFYLAIFKNKFNDEKKQVKLIKN
ncbi:MAG: SBBP repeat-containing protein, partial [Sphingobacteriaceae bacterium]